MPQIALTRRLRATPFTDLVNAAGVQAYTVYNHMLLPAMFRSLDADYHHLKSAVQLWDVACERQVEISGPDAHGLVQLMTPRDLSGLAEGHCAYSPIVDDAGRILNDPVIMRIAPDRYWISIADSDIVLFAKGLAAGAGLAVQVREPDVHPLAVQGPHAADVIASAFGEDIRKLGFFRWTRVPFGGRDHLIARSGYSVQGGFEIYLDGADLGPALWQWIMDAGRPWDIAAGGPNLIERIEGGLLSYGSDMTAENTPLEAGLGRYCHPDRVDCLGRDALLAERATGPARQIRFLKIDGPPMANPHVPLPLLAEGARVGQVTSAAFSPDYRTNVAIAMVERSHWADGTVLDLSDPVADRRAIVGEKPVAA